jgi:hypothetical protein
LPKWWKSGAEHKRLKKHYQGHLIDPRGYEVYADIRSLNDVNMAIVPFQYILSPKDVSVVKIPSLANKGLIRAKCWFMGNSMIFANVSCSKGHK